MFPVFLLTPGLSRGQSHQSCQGPEHSDTVLFSHAVTLFAPCPHQHPKHLALHPKNGGSRDSTAVLDGSQEARTSPSLEQEGPRHNRTPHTCFERDFGDHARDSTPFVGPSHPRCSKSHSEALESMSRPRMHHGRLRRWVGEAKGGVLGVTRAAGQELGEKTLRTWYRSPGRSWRIASHETRQE